MRTKIYRIFAVLIALILFSSNAVKSEEGMWTLDNLPLKNLKNKYKFVPTNEWLDHVRLSSVRFSDGGSGSFISPTGLVLTNHHVAEGQLQKMSSANKDYLKCGFQAKSLAEEVKCPDLELNVLVDMKNVTDIVQKASKGKNDKEIAVNTQKVIAKIEKENSEKTKLRCEVVNLYHGGEYWLYTYKKYRDVRMVFAPEKSVAYFGGDYDNFTYPRYDLDFTILRAYENDKPAQIKNYLKVNTNGIKNGELIFVSGNPGSTDRLITYAQFEFSRDFQYPFNINYFKHKIKVLDDYSKRGPEQKRRAGSVVFSLQNSMKAQMGEFEGLKNKNINREFKKRDMELKKSVLNNPTLKKEIGDPWTVIDNCLNDYKKNFKIVTYRVTEGRLPELAMAIVFYAIESKKPDGERLAAYHEAKIDALKYELFSPAPIYKDLDEVLLADHMKTALKELGPNDEYLKILLDGKTPEARAKELIQGTKLADVEYRKSLIKGGMEALKKSDDPLIKVALKLEPVRRKIKKWAEVDFFGVLNAASQKVAKARFKVYGKNTYPDATFTLRLSYGAVKGYPYNGTIAPYQTTFYGMFDRYYSFNKEKNEWMLPERFLEGKNKIEMTTPLNFVTTNDIIGGNSGSPLINRDGEIVGLAFDGNMESLPGNFMFDETANRCVALNLGAIVEVLKKMYNADGILNEIIGK
jgi:hypothetical protein